MTQRHRQGEASLRLRHLQVAYPLDGRPVPVLDRLSFDLHKGEVVSLLGESGSGKSTIARALTGLLPPSAQIGSGVMTIGAGPDIDLSGKDAPWAHIRGRRIAMLFQDAQQALNPLLTIQAHFRESLRFHRLAAGDEAREIGALLLASLNFSDPRGVLARYPFELSGGMCQRVCLALALCLQPDVLIADEPTSALDTVSQKEVLDLLQAMRKKLNLTVLFITHDIAVANAISDRVIVLNGGSIEEEGDTRTVLTRPAAAYTRGLLAARAQVTAAVRETEQPATNEPLLALEQVDKSFGRKQQQVLRQVDLTLHGGEILGIAGQSGSGKSTLARLIAGLEPPGGGRILLRGADIGRLRGKRRRELCRRIQLVFQDARASLNQGRTALQLVQEPLRYLRIGGGRQERERLATFYLNEVGIAGEAQRRRPPQLSTGQCQRVAIARALVVRPEVLICDEAVSALDMSIQARILALLMRLHRQYGFALLMISHDMRVLRSFCHRIAVMHNGHICEIGQADTLLRDSKHSYTQLLLRCAGDLEDGLD
ncbi:nickel ABC transporter ATP-binding protein NikE [Paenibacillus cymbidii]|uniref:nickel ABC transporter ATP-binding protein NikE n=1 Tax=Paenibacillus cymbidii TaxID=1639034 RepID=UPI0010807900|nr:ABC transporter ATP-binding protein [Paenibacillus cymbidii]